MELKCPFAMPLTKGLAGCHNAQAVVRRGGTELDCRSEAAHRVCTSVFEGLKSRALPAFGVEDDLTLMPHSVLVKVQSGGLLGLKRLLGEISPGTPVPDIAGLIGEAIERYGSPKHVPYSELEQDMLSFKLERRTRRG
jgi:hypothetical protein